MSLVLSVSTWIFTLIIVYLIAKLFLIVTWRTDYAKMLRVMKGPSAMPLLGNAWDLWVPHQEIFMSLVKMINAFPKESLVRFWIGQDGYVVAQKARSIETILTSNKHISKSDDYSYLHSWLGMGLLTSTGEKWQTRRKMLTPSFHFRILDDFITIFNEQSQIFVDILRKRGGKEPFDIYPFVTHCALDIICESTMGKNVNAQQVVDSDYVKAVYGMGAIMLMRIARPWLQPAFLFNLTSHRRNEKAFLKVLHGFSKKVIEERRELVKQKKEESTEKTEEIFGKKRRLAFLDLLLEASVDGKGLSNEDIREEVDTFMFEGHDTTSAGIAWTLYLLGHNPQIQRKVQEELDQVLGQKSDRPLTSVDLSKLKYLEAVIKESLRIYPSVPLFGRKLKENALIDGVVIPAETTVFIGPYFAHRDPEVFPDPEKFDPERFLSEAAVGRNPFAYVPFSAGPRNCIGQKFAMMEEKVVLADVLRNFNFVSHDKPEDITLVSEPILRPVQGIVVTLSERI